MTADVMRISDWSSDVCSSDLIGRVIGPRGIGEPKIGHQEAGADFGNKLFPGTDCTFFVIIAQRVAGEPACMARCVHQLMTFGCRSEEHTSELQSLMRISYAVFCLKKNT